MKSAHDKHMAIYNIPYTEKLELVQLHIDNKLDLDYYAAKYHVRPLTFRQHVNRWTQIEYRKKMEQQDIENSWYYKKDLSFSERLNLAVNG